MRCVFAHLFLVNIWKIYSISTPYMNLWELREVTYRSHGQGARHCACSKPLAFYPRISVYSRRQSSTRHIGIILVLGRVDVGDSWRLRFRRQQDHVFEKGDTQNGVNLPRSNLRMSFFAAIFVKKRDEFRVHCSVALH